MLTSELTHVHDNLRYSLPPSIHVPRIDGALTLIQSCMPNFWAFIRIALIAAVVSWPHQMTLYAEETRPGWLPEVLKLPGDMEVITDRAIGSTLRMFSFTTESNPDDLLAMWEGELGLAGYTIDQGQDNMLDKIVEFSGSGINNAKIVIAPLEDDGRAVIEFDAALQ